jgi:GMP synthase (glutamine-hydrolysing)
MGDERTYEKMYMRAVEDTDGMTADWVQLPKFCKDTSNECLEGKR